MHTPQFHYSPEFWPNPPLPIPRTWPYRGTLRVDDQGWLREDESEAERGRLRYAMGDEEWPALPHEVHLRDMREVDLSDPQSICMMSQRIGPALDSEAPGRGMSFRGMAPNDADLYQSRFVADAAERYGLPDPFGLPRPAGGIHVAEVAARVHSIRILVDHVRAALAGQPTAELWRREGLFDLPESYSHALPGKRPVVEEPAERVAWHFFAEVLNQGLFDVSPRITVDPLDSEEAYDDVVFSYTAACVMVFNDLNEGAPYRVCADETCRTEFKVQPGRDGSGSSRSRGVLYCCPLHARNQAQRDRRRRERAARAQER